MSSSSSASPTLQYIRQKFWSIGGRRALRNITQRCVTCHRYKAKVAAEVCPPLPEDQVVHERPFTTTGNDDAGPLYVRPGESSPNVWIALFVCATTSEVHLEVVESLSTESFLIAFRKFVARRGLPSRIRSDNATTFKAASDKLSVPWMFNPSAAP